MNANVALLRSWREESEAPRCSRRPDGDAARADGRSASVH
jgi:hypothetical protein